MSLLPFVAVLVALSSGALAQTETPSQRPTQELADEIAATLTLARQEAAGLAAECGAEAGNIRLENAARMAASRLGRSSMTAERLTLAVDSSAEAIAQAVDQAIATLSFRPTFESPAPDDFPPVTPVGEIEAKTYPQHRVARAAMNPRISPNRAFYQLFEHIQRHGIAMTAPVETRYAGETERDGRASMGFLYRHAEMGEAGEDGSVDVVDVAPMSVVSIGMRGYAMPAALKDARERLEDWLRAEGMEASGELRVLEYNSPFISEARRYFEVQFPIDRAPTRQHDTPKRAVF